MRHFNALCVIPLIDFYLFPIICTSIDILLDNLQEIISASSQVARSLNAPIDQ